MRLKTACIFLMIITWLFFNSCSNTTEPGESNKDPREMTWTVDTLYYPQSLQTNTYNLLALNSGHIYAYGHCDFVKGSVFEYNGHNWKPLELLTRFKKMIALSETNIWGFGGSSAGVISHYNGYNWMDDHSINAPFPFQGATADLSNTIYACGDKGIVARYNWDGWSYENTNLKLPCTENYSLFRIGYFNNRLFFNGIAHSESTGDTWYYFISKEGDKYKLLDSVKNWPSKYTWGTNGFYKSPWGKYFSFGRGGIWQLMDDKWVPYYETENVYDFVSAIQGTSEDYYFILKYTDILFCNVSAKTSIKNKINIDYNNILLEDIWTDGREVFITGLTTGPWPTKTIIIHGK